MAANECIPLITPGESRTAFVEAAVTGKRFVAISGPMVGDKPQISPCPAGASAYGVAAYDRGAGDEVLVFKGAKMELPVTVGGAPVVAGTDCEVGAAGVAITRAAGIPVGKFLNDGAAGTDVFIELY